MRAARYRYSGRHFARFATCVVDARYSFPLSGPSSTIPLNRLQRRNAQRVPGERRSGTCGQKEVDCLGEAHCTFSGAAEPCSAFGQDCAGLEGYHGEAIILPLSP